MDVAARAQQAAPPRRHQAARDHGPGSHGAQPGRARGSKARGTGRAGRRVPSLTQAEADEANTIYFERCAGCHGVLRKGATGKALTPDITRELGFDYLRDFITYGSPGRHAELGHLGRVCRGSRSTLMARYLLNEPPAPPEFGMNEMRRDLEGASCRRTSGRPKDERPRPRQPVLGDAARHRRGRADRRRTYEIVKSSTTGYAVHISRMSASGRYLFVIGRDGKINLIDLWMEKPDTVAEVKIGLEARSVETSKFKGFEDKYAIAGAYWPPQYVIMDGDTLEPLKIVSTRGMIVDDAGLPSRAARRLDRRLPLQAGVHRQRQGNRQDPWSSTTTT